MRVILSLLGLLMAQLLVPASLAATYPPVPQGPVYDGENILPPDREAALDARLRDYNKRTGRALIVATVPSLDGDTVENYSAELFRAWGIGGKESDSGVLLLVAPTERQVRIEVGGGLEEFLPDGFVGLVILNDITPKFKAGDMPGGIEAGINALTTQLDRDPADAKAVAEAAAAAAAQHRSQASGGGGSAIGGAFVWIVIFIFVMSIFGRRRGGRRSGINPGVVLWGLSELSRGSGGQGSGWSSGGSDFGGGGGDFGGFGGGSSGGGGASGSW